MRIFVRNLAAVLIFISLQCCVPAVVRPPSPPFDNQEISQIIESFEEQESLADSLVSSGKLIMREEEEYDDEDDSESRYSILMVGRRDPFKVKIEITHPWGRPLLHLLINETHMQILSFHEKRLYQGRLGDLKSMIFFPVELGRDQIWTIIRGYPILGEHMQILSKKNDQIELLDKKGKTIQIIDFWPGSRLPRLLSYTGKGAKASFSDFKTDKQIKYARKIGFDDPEDRTSLEINIKTMVFNKAIPESIFKLSLPPGFEIVPIQHR